MTSQKTRLLAEAARYATAYMDAGPKACVTPTREAIAGLDALTNTLPDGPTDPSEVLDKLHRYGSPATVRSTSGRYFGFVNGGTEPIATAGGLLSAVWDQNLAQPIMSPVAAHLDAIAADWVCDVLGLAPTTTATFCAGATIANITCVLAARDCLLSRAGWCMDTDGMSGAPLIRVVTSAEIHISVQRALRVAGIGTKSITAVATDDRGRVRPSEMPTVDSMTLVVLQAGNVNTGHSDRFDQIIPACRDAGAWVHIDGAFGLWAAASPRQAHQVRGAELADSWATDAHKWLNTTYDSGIAICAREVDLRRAMAVDAAYIATDSPRALMRLGLQMSQRARGIEAWAVMAARGRSGIAAMIDNHCKFALRMADRLVAGGAELLAPVALNQVLVAFGSDTTTDQVIAAVQRDGTCWAGGTTWQGRRAMRISLCDSSMTEHDIDISADAILRCHTNVTGQGSSQ